VPGRLCALGAADPAAHVGCHARWVAGCGVGRLGVKGGKMAVGCKEAG
jgi:hypothetical protein